MKHGSAEGSARRLTGRLRPEDLVAGQASVAVANALAEGDDWPPRRRRRRRGGRRWAGIAALGALMLVCDQAPLEPPATTVTVLSVVTYAIEDVVQVGEVTVLVGYLQSLVSDGRVRLFQWNRSDTAQPGEVRLEDREGRAVEVGSPAGPLPGRSLRHQAIEVGPGFEQGDVRIAPTRKPREQSRFRLR